jgi:tRNA threonylcarbamoyladenosine biosynthesis protein TsaB
MERGHAEALIPMIERIMAEGGKSYADLDLVAATVGPGAFTGIRIGLAAARGLALAVAKPCAGVTTLEVVALKAGGPVLAAVESRRTDLFVQAFDARGVALGAAESLPPEGLPEFARETKLAPGFVLAGDGGPRAQAALGQAGIAARVCENTSAPDPALVATIAARRHGQASALPPKPFYLRPPDVTLPRNS